MKKYLDRDPLRPLVRSIAKQRLPLILIVNCETSMADLLSLNTTVLDIPYKATKHTVLFYYILNHRTFLEARRIAERNVLRSSSYIRPTTCAQLKKRHYFIRAGAHAETLAFGCLHLHVLASRYTSSYCLVVVSQFMRIRVLYLVGYIQI